VVDPDRRELVGRGVAAAGVSGAGVAATWANEGWAAAATASALVEDAATFVRRLRERVGRPAAAGSTLDFELGAAAP